MPSRRSYRSPGIGCSSDFSGIVTLRRPEELEHRRVIDRLPSGGVVPAVARARPIPLDESSESRCGGCDHVLTDLDQTTPNRTLRQDPTSASGHPRVNAPLRRQSESVRAMGIAMPSTPWLAADVAEAARCPTTLASRLLSRLTAKHQDGLRALSVQR